ncbi:MAG: MMPL family transporter [Actinobacteria bacterium]|nr:MMPL family transporter [Actinomycetota bacterium]
MSLSTGKVAAKCARHPWMTIGVWLVILVAAIAASSMLLSSALTTEMKFTSPTESDQGFNLLSDRLRGPERVKEIAVVTSKDATVDDPAFKAQVDLLALDLIALGSDVVEGGTYYYQFRDETLVSKDRHTTILPIVMAGTIADAIDNVDQIHEVAADAAERSGYEIVVTGTASSNAESNQLSESDLQKAELFGIPVAMIILVVVFGTLVAAGLPLILAGFSIIIAIGITALVGQQFEMSFFVVNMITMMGMAVGIDYSLFVVSRYREELLAGRDRYEAIEIAGSTASRAVLFSGMTVILALAGLLIVPMSIFYSLGAGAIFVVAVSVLAALTLLPAVLGLMGEKINSLRVPFIHSYEAGREGGEGGRFWDWITRKVMGRPVISAVLAVSLLLLPALYYFQIETGANGINALPAEFESRRGFEILDREFSFGLVSPVEIVIDGDVNSPAVKDAIARLQEELKGDEVFYGNGQVQTNDSGDLALLSVPVSGSPESDQATGAVKKLRQEYIPRIFADSGADVKITGASAMNLDYFNMTDDYRPIVFIFVLGLSFVLLTVVFHSLVVPLKAILMNLLSVGAAYGLIVLVFQEGIGASLFGFQQVPVIEAWVPIFLFSVLFGLSMDYHVFLLGRIRENYVLTGDNSESVASGLRSTGRIITGAALIMVAVFSGFASGQLVMFQQMGFGLAVSVLLDATIVRSVLVPATMKLLGDWNWYLPRWLQWLPDVHVEGGGGEPRDATVDSSSVSGHTEAGLRRH